MLHELFQIFRGFEQYEKARTTLPFVITYEEEPDPKMQEAIENYKRVHDELGKEQRFMRYLESRRDLLEALMQSVIDTSGAAIQASVERAANGAARQMTDKAVKFYFK